MFQGWGREQSVGAVAVPAGWLASPFCFAVSSHVFYGGRQCFGWAARLVDGWLFCLLLAAFRYVSMSHVLGFSPCVSLGWGVMGEFPAVRVSWPRVFRACAVDVRAFWANVAVLEMLHLKPPPKKT